MLNEADINKQILLSKVQYLYEDFHVRFAAFTVTSLLIAFVSSKVIETRYVLYWLLIGVVVFSIRSISHYIYKNYKDDIDAAEFWGKVFFYNAAITGIYFGLSSLVLYFSQSEMHMVTIGSIVFAYAIAVMNSSMSYMSAYYVFMVFALSPLVLVSFFSDSIYYTISISIISWLFMAIFYMISKGNGKVYDELLKLRFELQLQKESAEQANISKSKFLAAASHDLRQPLHAIGLFTNLLEKELISKSQKLYFSKVTHSLDSLRELLNTLLDVSKLDAGVVVKNNEHFKLEPLLKRLVSEFKTEANAKGLNFEYSSTESVIHRDITLLELILRNLLSNAIRYTTEGDIKLNITELDESKIRIDIIDTGIGIAKEKQQEIFQEFHQLDNPERDRVKGLGLGLAIVKRLVGLLNYSLEIESEPGNGTTFSVLVPNGDASKIKVKNTVKMIDAVISLNNIAVIIIDDDVQILEGMKQALQDWGCNVIVAVSESEALIKIKTENFVPEVIISDYRLREENTGAQAIVAIQHYIGKLIPALIITGDTAPERLREAQASGHTLLHKPVMPAQILAFIRRTVVQKNEVA